MAGSFSLLFRNKKTNKAKVPQEPLPPILTSSGSPILQPPIEIARILFSSITESWEGVVNSSQD